MFKKYFKVISEYLQLFIAVMGVSTTVIFIFIMIVMFSGCGFEQKDGNDLKTSAAFYLTYQRG